MNLFLALLFSVFSHGNGPFAAGLVYQDDGKTPAVGATLTLFRGSEELQNVKADKNGVFVFEKMHKVDPDVEMYIVVKHKDFDELRFAVQAPKLYAKITLSNDPRGKYVHMELLADDSKKEFPVEKDIPFRQTPRGVVLNQEYLRNMPRY